MNKIFFLACLFLSVSLTLKSQIISSKDILIYKNFVKLSNDFARQLELDPDLFEYDDHPDIYDISNNSDKSYIAVIGCFRHKMSCKYGMDFFIFKWDKKRNLLLLIEKPIKYSIVGFLGLGEKGKKFRDLYFIDESSHNICYIKTIKISFTNNKIKYDIITQGQDTNIPYSIIDFISKNKELAQGRDICDLIENASIIREETIRKKKYYYIRCFQDLKFQCDLEGVNCKLIEQK